MASIIRYAEKSDLDAICSVHSTAFGPDEGAEVASLVAALHEDSSAEPRLSLVAEDDGNVVGHILFTRVLLPGSDSDGDWPAARILCPLAVAVNQQHKGSGSRLIQEGLLLLKRDGVKLVLPGGLFVAQWRFPNQITGGNNGSRLAQQGTECPRPGIAST